MRDGETRVVLGTTDPGLHVDRVSSDVEDLVGLPQESVRGRSVLTLIDQRDATTMLLAIAEAV